MKELYFKPVKRQGFWYIQDHNNKFVSLDGKLVRAKSSSKIADTIAKLQYGYEMQRIKLEKGG